ncbi:unnamed protein product, partial [Symbiodinium necroappetens]
MTESEGFLAAQPVPGSFMLVMNDALKHIKFAGVGGRMPLNLLISSLMLEAPLLMLQQTTLSAGARATQNADTAADEPMPSVEERIFVAKDKSASKDIAGRGMASFEGEATRKATAKLALNKAKAKGYDAVLDRYNKDNVFSCPLTAIGSTRRSACIVACLNSAHLPNPVRTMIMAQRKLAVGSNASVSQNTGFTGFKRGEIPHCRLVYFNDIGNELCAAAPHGQEPKGNGKSTSTKRKGKSVLDFCRSNGIVVEAFAWNRLEVLVQQELLDLAQSLAPHSTNEVHRDFAQQ